MADLLALDRILETVEVSRPILMEDVHAVHAAIRHTAGEGLEIFHTNDAIHVRVYRGGEAIYKKSIPAREQPREG